MQYIIAVVFVAIVLITLRALATSKAKQSETRLQNLLLERKNQILQNDLKSERRQNDQLMISIKNLTSSVEIIDRELNKYDPLYRITRAKPNCQIVKFQN